MNKKRRTLIAIIVVGLLASIIFSRTGKGLVERLFAGFSNSASKNGTTDASAESVSLQTVDLGARARARHGWTTALLNSVMRGSISFYDRDGNSTRQAAVTVYRLYPDRLRVELTRGASTEVFGFNQTDAWSSLSGTLNARQARDLRAWLRFCPERLFTTRTVTNYREAGRRVEISKPGRPWQGQEQLAVPKQLEQVEIEDLIGVPPDATRVGDRRFIVYYLNRQDFTVESARWLEPDNPTRRIDDLQEAKSDVRLDFDNWQTVSGVLWPFEIVKWNGGRVEFRVQVSQVQFNQTLADSLFQQP